MRPRRVELALLVPALAALPAPAPAPAPAAGGEQATFAQVVARNFPRWDLDGDGRLQVGEVDRLLKDPSILGQDAAALATIKFRDRWLPEADRASYAAGLRELSEPAAPEPESPPGRPAATPYFYEPQFRRFRDELAATPNRMFARGRPEFEQLRQGPIGDCFFFSVTGALAFSHPQRIVSMIRPGQDRTWEVRFPGRTVSVPRVTEAEALVNNARSTMQDGYWVAVLEMAVGEVLRQGERADRRTPDPFDAIANGGSSPRIIELYTGHRAYSVAFRERSDEGRRLGEIRRTLLSVLQDGHLATLTMLEPPDGRPRVPGLAYNHAYAVLDYNRVDDQLTIWNPWGDPFTPKGPAGPEYGFPTKHGVFRMPLPVAYQQFSFLHFESDQQTRD